MACNCKKRYTAGWGSPLFSIERETMLRHGSRALEQSASVSASATASEAVRAIKAVGDRTRLQILRVLLRGELCVTDLARELGLAQPRVSHHLTILRNSSLVRDRRSGKRIFYTVNPDFLVNGNSRERQSIQVDCLRVEFPES